MLAALHQIFPCGIGWKERAILIRPAFYSNGIFRQNSCFFDFRLLY